MKKIKYFLIGAIILGIINFSCKKNPNTPPSNTIEYIVTPMNYNVDTIWYRDSANHDIEVSGPLLNPKSHFSVDGSQTVQVGTPFTAMLKIAYWHTDTPNPNYDLKILVNGEVKKEATVANTGKGYSEIDYTIQ